MAFEPEKEFLKIDQLLSSEGISDANSSYHLAVVQIFDPEHVTSRFRRGLKHHSIPEVELRLFLECDCAKNIIGSGRKHLPCGEFANAVGGLIDRKRMRDLSCHGDEELLQYLHTEASDATFPKACEQLFGHGLFLAG